MPSSGVYGFQIWSTKLVEYKSQYLGLPLGKKIEFTIPEEIFQNDKLSRNFLRGYFDTDGCLYLEKKNEKLYPRVEVSTISKKFSKQLVEILSRLGFSFHYYKLNRKSLGWKDIYRIIIRGKPMTIKWFKEIKPKNPKHIKKFALLKKE
jgi:intein/homing endonuclease